MCRTLLRQAMQSTGTKRKLAAILAADAVGYSRLMGDDDEATVEGISAAREQLDQADALFRDMGMDWWTEQAEGRRGRIDSGQDFVWFAPYVDGPPPRPR